MEYELATSITETQKLIAEYRMMLNDHKLQIEYYKGVVDETKTFIEKLEDLLAFMVSKED